MQRAGLIASNTVYAGLAVVLIVELFSDAAWVDAVGYTLVGIAVAIFVITFAAISLSATRGGRPARELKRAAARWWASESVGLRVTTVGMVLVGLVISLYGVATGPPVGQLSPSGDGYLMSEDGMGRAISGSEYHTLHFASMMGALGMGLVVAGYVGLVFRSLLFGTDSADSFLDDVSDGTEFDR